MAHDPKIERQRVDVKSILRAPYNVIGSSRAWRLAPKDSHPSPLSPQNDIFYLLLSFANSQGKMKGALMWLCVIWILSGTGRCYTHPGGGGGGHTSMHRELVAIRIQSTLISVVGLLVKVGRMGEGGRNSLEFLVAQDQFAGKGLELRKALIISDLLGAATVEVPFHNVLRTFLARSSRGPWSVDLRPLAAVILTHTR